MRALAPLVEARKLGPVLWQLPATSSATTTAWPRALDGAAAGRHCFEFRHPSWFAEEVVRLLRRHGAALVIGDHPQRPFQTHDLTAAWTFVRFHYGAARPARQLLRARARDVGAADRRGAPRAEVFAYFNNDWEAFAPRNARWLADRLS